MAIKMNVNGKQKRMRPQKEWSNMNKQDDLWCMRGCCGKSY